MKQTKNTIMIIVIFSLWSCFAQNKKGHTAIKHVGFGRLFEKNAVTYDVNPENEDKTALVVSDYIKLKKGLSFK